MQCFHVFDLYVAHISYKVYVRKNYHVSSDQAIYCLENNIYIKIQVIFCPEIIFVLNKSIHSLYVLYQRIQLLLDICCHMATHYPLLPTHMYVLHNILATPKNATHRKSVGKCVSNAYINV
jgi:hypothetical protein